MVVVNLLWVSMVYGGWGIVVGVVVVVLSIILLFILQHKRFFSASSSSSPPLAGLLTDSSINSNLRDKQIARDQIKLLGACFEKSDIVTDADLKFLMEILDENLNHNDKWEDVIDKTNHQLCYKAKSCKPKTGPLRYLSVTVFDDISVEMLRNFYMDNEYRKKWDKTVVEHNQLQVDESDGSEVGCTVKKFPLLKPREYVLTWKLWEGRDKTFYCYMKECEHPLAPRQRKYVRVEFFRSGWRIRKVPGRNACEITMVHQEDAGLNTEMAKLAFSKGIWSYVCKMDNALRRYSAASCHLSSSVTTSVNLMQKVPAYLESSKSDIFSADPAIIHDQVTHESQVRVISRRPSRKLVANGLLLLGGAICLSRGHSSLGAKVAMAYIVSKLSNRSTNSNQITQS